MPNVNKNDQTGAVGVTQVQLVVERDMGWIYRRQEHRDTGLDAEVEAVLRGEATGLVLGLQIKTGKSYFSEPTANGWKYRGNYDHLRYWREHNLAVLVVLVDLETETAYWTFVGPDVEVHEAGKSWTIEIPRRAIVSEACVTPWMDLAFAVNPCDALYRYCAIHARYIQLLEDGGTIFLEADEWVNKTRGQAEFKLLLEDPDGRRTTEEFFVFAGVREVHEFVLRVFPWANVTLDEDYYEEHEDVPPEAVFQDDESPGGYYVVEGERPTGIRPYSDNGEVASFRFELTLNDVGRAFAEIARAASALPKYPPYYFARILARGDE